MYSGLTRWLGTLSFVGAVGVVGAACHDTPAEPDQATTWEVRPSTAVLEVGFTRQFQVVDSAQGLPPPPDLPVFWIYDRSVAFVTGGGVARAVGPGEVSIGAVVDRLAASEAVLRVEPLRFRQIAAASAATCGVSTVGVAYCWGRGKEGTLGYGGEDDRLTPTPIDIDVDIAAISVQYKHACALDVDGAAYCWGDNVEGRLGNGEDRGIVLSPRPVLSTVRFTAISAGSWFTCALAVDAAAYCWGANDFGSVGDGTTEHRYEPVPVSTERRFASLSAGALHACVIDESGNAFCWGDNRGGQLGDGTRVNRTTPSPVIGDIEFRAISAGVGYTCGVSVAGQGYCWGANTFTGRLGTGDLQDRTDPAPVLVDEPLTEIAATGTLFACGLAESGAVYCWGSNLTGQLGVPPGEVPSSPTPLRVPGSILYRSLSATGSHVCAIARNDLTYCWGANPWGQFGIGQYSVGSHEPTMPTGQVPP